MKTLNLDKDLIVLNVSLFLGLPVDAAYEKALAKIDPQVRELFISNAKESYLNQVTVDDVCYLGKFLGDIAYVPELELLEKNIYSILNKMIPNHSCESIPLEVLVVSSPST